MEAGGVKVWRTLIDDDRKDDMQTEKVKNIGMVQRITAST